MAGPSTGATAPTSPLSLPAAPSAPHLVPASTRKRRNHGAFTLGGQLACVYSTRSAGRCYGVSVELGAGTLTLAGSMTPTQARNMARALSAAADAADAVRGGGAA